MMPVAVLLAFRAVIDTGSYEFVPDYRSRHSAGCLAQNIPLWHV